MMKPISKLTTCFLLSFVAGSFLSCFDTPLAPKQSAPNIKFQFGNLATAPTEGWLPDILNRMPPGLPPQADLDEVRIAVLSLPNLSDGDEFMTAWAASNQSALIDTSKWNDNLDFFDNAFALLQSYPGDFYRFGGDFTLSVAGDTARGTINASPGLTYFLIALRQNGTTQDWGETFFTVDRDSENLVCYGCGGPIVEITSPADGSVVTSNVITISGTVSDTSITEATLTLDQVSQSIPVNNGTFSNPVVLSVGQNRIIIQASNEEGTGSEAVTVEFQGQPAALRATLVWDTDGTDLDLEMENPNGEVSNLTNSQNGGMMLDVDDFDGFGPENISVNQPMSGEYIVRVINFSAAAGFGTTATVYIFSDETLIDIQTHPFSGADVNNTWEAARVTLP